MKDHVNVLLAIVALVVIGAVVIVLGHQAVPDQLWQLGGIALGAGAGVAVPRLTTSSAAPAAVSPGYTVVDTPNGPTAVASTGSAL